MIGNRIRQARVAAGMTQDEVVGALATAGVSLTKAGLSKYERGGSVPKPTVLRGLARALGVEMAFFLEEPSSRMEWLAFRKTSRLGKKRGDAIKTFAEHQVETVLTLQRALEPKAKPLNVPRTSVSTLDDAEKAAATVRKQWHLGDRPVNSVTAAIEDGGGVVVEVETDHDFFDGLSGWADDSVPVIVVSAAATDDRRRFSLAHELGHLVMKLTPQAKRNEESLAHRFAAAFLVPASTARRELGLRRRHLDFRELAMLKQKHGLSMQAWIYRAADLQIVSQAHARTMFAEMSSRGWRRREPVEFEGKERPSRLQQLVVRSLAEGLISQAQAERLFPGLPTKGEVMTRRGPGALDARSLRRLSAKERDRLMSQAAAVVHKDYEDDGDLTGFESLSEDDHHDVPVDS